MPFSIPRTGTSVGYGALELVTEYVDQTTMSTSAAGVKTPTFGAPGTFKNITDWVRPIASIGGGVGTYLVKPGMMSDMLEALELSSIPGFMKTITNAVLLATKSTSPFKASPHGELTLRREQPSGFRTTLGAHAFRTTLG